MSKENFENLEGLKNLKEELKATIAVSRGSMPHTETENISQHAASNDAGNDSGNDSDNPKDKASTGESQTELSELHEEECISPFQPGLSRDAPRGEKTETEKKDMDRPAFLRR